MVYDAIDGSDGFYRGHADAGSRSLDERHVAPATPRIWSADSSQEAAAQGLVELKGHRSVGGIRASLYNAMPLAGAQALAGVHADVRGDASPAASPSRVGQPPPPVKSDSGVRRWD